MKARTIALQLVALVIASACGGESDPGEYAVGGGPRGGRSGERDGGSDAATSAPEGGSTGGGGNAAELDAAIASDAGGAGECAGGDCPPPPPACDAAVCAVLLDLEPSRSALHPAFDPNVTEYTLDLGVAPASFTLTPTAAAGVVIEVDGALADSGDASAAIDAPAQIGDAHDVEITVSVGDESTSYVVHARRTWRRVLDGKASNADPSDRFGSAVAISGDLIVVGAPEEASSALGVDGDQSSDDAVRSGAAYVFRRTAQGWEQEAYLKASNTGANDGFGSSVAISGELIVVGAPGERSDATLVDGDEADDSLIGPGAAYVFRRVDGTWQQDAYLKASNTEEDDAFGVSVAVSGDLVVVGADQEDGGDDLIDGDDASDAEPGSGAAYVYRYAGGAWELDAYVKASNTGGGDAFGHRVALDGDVLAISAPGERSRATGVDGDMDDEMAFDSGAVYVYRRVSDTWELDAYLKASNTDAEDAFGSALALAGELIVVGADQEDSATTGVDGDGNDDAASASGAAYVFRFASGSWQHDAYLKADNTDAGDRFGAAVAVGGDVIAVGAHAEAGSGTGVDPENDDRADYAGAVYVFRRSGDAYQQEAYVKGPGPLVEGGRFGAAVALDGEQLVIGARDDSSGGIAASGAIHAYE